MLNQLGPFRFVTFHGPQGTAQGPGLPKQTTEILARPGVAGAGVLKTGIRGLPCVMISGVDVPDFDSANDLKAAYYLAIATSLNPAQPVKLIWGSVDYEANYKTRYVVLDVEEIETRKISAAVGGLNANPRAWLAAQWTLLPVLV